MSPRVLYAEDHEDTRVLVALLLRAAGFEVTEAACGSEALRLARSSRFDLYVLDNAFPDVTGVEVCRAIREFDAGTPILFYSGRAMSEEREEALRAGAQDYMVKPDNTLEIPARAARLVGLRE